MPIALAGTWAAIVSGVAFTVMAAFIIAVAGATMRLFRNVQQRTRDEVGLREFFFDTDANPRSGVPAKKGWTTVVDETLAELTRSNARTERAVNQILHEVQPNGGDNLRHAVDQTAVRAEKVEKAVTDANDPT